MALELSMRAGPIVREVGDVPSDLPRKTPRGRECSLW